MLESFCRVSHTTSRNEETGVNALSFNEDDYQAYVRLLAKACRAQGTEVWAWCLMPNHVHLVLVPSSEDGLRASITQVHRHYTRRINFREGWRGHLWQERFHSFPMDESYLLATVRYVELNPVKARLVQYPPDWRWSSARARLGQEPDGLTTLKPLDQMIYDWPSFWAMDGENESDLIELHARTGRPLGSKTFLDEAERLSGRRLRRQRPGPKKKANNDSHQQQLWR